MNGMTIAGTWMGLSGILDYVIPGGFHLCPEVSTSTQKPTRVSSSKAPRARKVQSLSRTPLHCLLSQDLGTC